MTTGHNSGALTENEEKALFFYHVRRDMASKARLKEIQAQIKADRKLAQADNIALSRIDFAEKALDADDKTTITQKVNDQIKIMEWLNIIPPASKDLFADRAPKEEKIEGQGEIAGMSAEAGVSRTSPYAKGSTDDEAWLRGWDRGQAIMRDDLESAMTKKRAAKSNEEPPAASGTDPFATAKPSSTMN
jgi:hypothetical protein